MKSILILAILLTGCGTQTSALKVNTPIFKAQNTTVYEFEVEAGWLSDFASAYTSIARRYGVKVSWKPLGVFRTKYLIEVSGENKEKVKAAADAMWEWNNSPQGRY